MISADLKILNPELMCTMLNIDIDIINLLQKGLPVSRRPYQNIAHQLGVDEKTLLQRIRVLLDEKKLTRFGPMFDVRNMGGISSLAAMQIPDEDYQRVTDIVNSFHQVAHNYRRDHRYNMWFVICVESVEELAQVEQEISQQSGIKILSLPKIREYYLKLQLPLRAEVE